jgi:hypothetical protein
MKEDGVHLLLRILYRFQNTKRRISYSGSVMSILDEIIEIRVAYIKK